MDFLNELLSKIPFNGAKTVVGGLLTAFPIWFPTLVAPTGALVQQVGSIVLAVGVLHKAIKALRGSK